MKCYFRYFHFRKLILLIALLSSFASANAQLIIDTCFNSAMVGTSFSASANLWSSNSDLLQWNGSSWSGGWPGANITIPPANGGSGCRAIFCGSSSSWTSGGEVFGFRIQTPLVSGTTYSIPITYVSHGTGSTGSFSPYLYTNNSPGMTGAVTVGNLPAVGYTWTTNTISFTATAAQNGHNWIIIGTMPSGSSGMMSSYCCDLPSVCSVNLGPDQTICQGQTYTFDATTTGATYLWSTGATTATITTGIAGIYSVTITDASSCTATDNVTLTVNPNLAVNLGPDQSICQGQTYTFNATTTGATYIWSNSATTPTISPGVTGNYAVTVTVNGCTGTDDVNLTVNSNPTVNLGPDQIVCQGQTYTFDATTTGATYLWSNSATTSNISPGVPGNYAVTVTVSGCTGTDDVNLTVNPNPSPNLGPDQSVCQGQTYTFDATTTGANYLWSNSATTATISPGISGNYAVTVTVNGCIGTDDVNLAINPNPSVNLGPDQVICPGQTYTFNATTAGATYLWSNSATTSNISPGLAGNYSVTVTDAFGCTGTDQVVLAIAPSLSPAITGLLAICSGASTTLSAGIGFANYQWSSGSTSQTITVGTTGTYSVTVSDAGGCTGTDQADVTVYSNPSPGITGTLSFCTGSSVTLDAGAGYNSYVWNQAATTQIISITNGGTYTVTVTDNNGCTGTDQVDVTASTSIFATLSPINVTCYGEANGEISVDLSGGIPPYSIQWSNGSTLEDIQNLGAGNYTVTITDQIGCTFSDGQVITEPTELVYTGYTEPTSCFGKSDGSATIQVSGGVTPYQYQWSNGNPASTATGLLAGFYSVTVSDANSCSATAHFTITEPAEVTVSANADPTICIGQSVDLLSSVTGGTAPYTTIWNNGSTTPGITVSPAVTTVYFVTAQDANSCPSNSDNVTVFVNPPLTATAAVTPNDICLGESVVLSVVPAGGNGNYSFFINNDPALNPATLFPEENITYEIVVSDNCGTPVVTLQVPVTVRPLPPVSFNSDKVNGCVPLNIHFNEMSPNLGQTYVWDFGDGGSNNTSIEKSPEHTYETAGTFDVNVEVTSVDGCINHLTIPMLITAYPLPEPQFIPLPDITSVINPVVHFDNLSTNNWLSLWSFGDGDSSQTMEPWHRYPANPGNYTITLTVFTEFGCKDTVMGTVTIKDEYTFYAPNAFSPDADGHNEYFLPVGHGIEPDSWLMQIYDRWGNVLFETQDVSEPWRGEQQNGKLVPVGSYTWYVYFKDLSGIGHEFTGSVTVIR